MRKNINGIPPIYCNEVCGTCERSEQISHFVKGDGAKRQGDLPCLLQCAGAKRHMPPLESKGAAACCGGFIFLNSFISLPVNTRIPKENHMSDAKSVIKINARYLRSHMTEHEQLIWYRIRRRQIDDVQFYRQKPLGPFIVDFYAPAIRLVLEIDGSQHFEEEHCEQDKFRDDYLRRAKIHVLRFNNYEIKYQMDDVLEKLNHVIQQKKQFGKVRD